MPSPFPGMNPFLEQPDAWPDFHNLFVARLATDINARAPERYYAKVEDQLYIHELAAEHWRPFARTDVSVRDAGTVTSPGGGTATVEAPSTVEIADAVDIVNLPYVEIRSRDGGPVVTVVEVLSPANKLPGPDREQFARKRQRLCASASHYVEVDLLRGGARHAFRGRVPECTYYVMVAAVHARPSAGFWPVMLREPLPTTSIPLLPGDTALTVDWQGLLHQVYDEGRFRSFIYGNEPQPPLSPVDTAWASQFVSSITNHSR